MTLRLLLVTSSFFLPWLLLISLHKVNGKSPQYHFYQGSAISPADEKPFHSISTNVHSTVLLTGWSTSDYITPWSCINSELKSSAIVSRSPCAPCIILSLRTTERTRRSTLPRYHSPIYRAHGAREFLQHGSSSGLSWVLRCDTHCLGLHLQGTQIEYSSWSHTQVRQSHTP